ncbi:hypothetical protein ACHAQJ_006477 [Trichoderma viride]
MDNVSQEVAYLTWVCITTSSFIHPLFDFILCSNIRVYELFLLAGFTFCSGLFDVLSDKDSPPSIDYFASLAAPIPDKSWGVYFLVLRKPGFQPLAYIGSGTSTYRVLRVIVKEHQTQRVISDNLRAAYRNGYELISVTILCHCPIPGPDNFGAIRALTIAVEATFSCVFWAMANLNKQQASREMFEYGGLCSHNALLEGFRDCDTELTPEQRVAKAAIIQEKNRAYQDTIR